MLPADLPPIRVVQYKQRLYSLDNRRLWIFHSLPAPCLVPVQLQKQPTKEFWQKFTSHPGCKTPELRSTPSRPGEGRSYYDARAAPAGSQQLDIGSGSSGKCRYHGKLGDVVRWSYSNVCNESYFTDVQDISYIKSLYSAGSAEDDVHSIAITVPLTAAGLDSSGSKSRSKLTIRPSDLLLLSTQQLRHPDELDAGGLVWFWGLAAAPEVFKQRPSPQSVQRFCLQSCRLVFCTVSTAGSRVLADAGIFPVTVVDEAAQLVEAESAILLARCCRYQQRQQMMLVGDPKQLPATVISRTAAQQGYSRSLFERLQLLGLPALLLDVQYRCRPEISYWPNYYFYSGRLKDGSNLSVGIITPYRRQVAALLQQITPPDRTDSGCADPVLVSPGMPVSVRSVDGFQGQERDIIVMSCVRANSRQQIGFLADPRRLNVALTRARYSLIVVCNARTLAVDPAWEAFLRSATSRGLLKVLPC
eukprot:gene7630-7832_t